MYGFLLEAVWEGTYVEAVAATEEGLLRVAQEYTQYYGQTDEAFTKEMCIQLRWGSPEDGWYENYEAGLFKNANELISQAHEAGFMEIGDQQLQQMCLEVLRELDGDQIFGDRDAREKIIIGVCDVGGDNTEEDFLGWVEAVNSPDVMAQLRSELKAADKSYQATKELQRLSRKD
jgi:hypothetical protein